MFLQQGDRVFGGQRTEKGHTQGGLLPGAGVAEQAHFPGREAFLDSQRDRHGRNELVSGAEGALGQGQDGIQVILLHPNGGVAQLVQGDLAVGMPAGLVVGDVPVLTPAAVGDVD